MRRSRVLMALLLVVGVLAWLGVGRPVVRHNREARRVGLRLAAVVRAEVGPPGRVRTWVGDAPGTNGGHCWFHARLTVATSLLSEEVVARIERVLDPLYISVEATREADGVVRVDGIAMGEGGTPDPRCG